MQRFDPDVGQTERAFASRGAARTAPLLIFCALLWCAWARAQWSSVQQVNGIDFYDYYTASQALGRRPLADNSALYSKHMRRRLGLAAYRAAIMGDSWRQLKGAQAFPTLEPTSSPYTYTIWRLLLHMPYDDGYRLVQASSLALFVCALFGLGTLLGLTPGLTAVLGLAVCADSLALASDVRVCNVNRLLVCGLTIFLWLQARAHSASLAGRKSNATWQLATGIWITCMVAFKPVVGSMLTLPWIAALCRGERRDCALQSAGVAFGGAGVVAVSLANFGGLRAWSRWLSSITTTLSDDVTTVAQGNWAPVRVLEAFWPDLPLRAYGVAIAALMLLYVVVVHVMAARAPKRDQSATARVRHNMLLLGVGFTFTICTSRLVWLHWQLLFIPAMFALAPTGALRRRGDIIHALLWLAGTLLLSTNGLTAFDDFKPPLDTVGAVLTADVIFAGLCFAGIWKAAGVQAHNGLSSPGASARTAFHDVSCRSAATGSPSAREHSAR